MSSVSCELTNQTNSGSIKGMEKLVNEPKYKSMGIRIAATRLALGLARPVKMRKAIGRPGRPVGANTYSQWEAGTRRPNLEDMMRLCDRFGVTLDWIYRGNMATLPQTLIAKINDYLDPVKTALDRLGKIITIEVTSGGGDAIWWGPERRLAGSEADYAGPEQRRPAHVRRL